MICINFKIVFLVGRYYNAYRKGEIMKSLDTYVKLVPFLAKSLGENVEIVLHDLSSPDAPIIAIGNGEISGRHIGDSVTALGRQYIEEKQYEHMDYVINYKTFGSNGKLLRSCSYFIKEDEVLIGMLCINVNISDYGYLNEALRRILGIQEDASMQYHMDTPLEVFSNQSIETKIKQCMNDAIVEMGYPTFISKDRLTVEEKMHLMKKLQDLGIFNVKGAISVVARELGSSEPTIYRYLKKL